jgi:hypothetical protein
MVLWIKETWNFQTLKYILLTLAEIRFCSPDFRIKDADDFKELLAFTGNLIPDQTENSIRLLTVVSDFSPVFTG